MGKRSNVEKPSSTNIVPPDRTTASGEVTNASINETDEPYTLTNIFAQDFRELAKRSGFHGLQVLTRPLRPNQQPKVRLDSAPTPGRNEKKDDKKQEESLKRTEVSPSSEVNAEPLPTSYAVRNKFDYFKPSVQVVWDEEGNKNMIKEMYIKGWCTDPRIMDILNLTLPHQEKLAKIQFWNTGLSDELFETFAGLMKQLPSVKTLSLDGNPMNHQKYDLLLGEDSTLQNLSLRNCGITDVGANHIGQALLTNKNLLTLNLCYNKITSEGAILLTKGLRINRSLLCLDLGSNFIGDDGACKLAETISRFVLNHEETVARRHLLSKKSVEEPTSQHKPVLQGTLKNERPPSVRSGSHLSKDDRQKKDKQKGQKKDGKKVEDKPAKKASSTDAAKDSKKGKKGSLAKADKKGGLGIMDQETSDVVEFPNPLLETVQEIGGDLYIPGNRALINLNLSRNKIGEVGMRSLLNAVQYQSQLAMANTRPSAVGLLRLSIQKNTIADDNFVFHNLQELMMTRDPYFKMENHSREDITPIKELE